MKRNMTAAVMALAMSTVMTAAALSGCGQTPKETVPETTKAQTEAQTAETTAEKLPQKYHLFYCIRCYLLLYLLHICTTRPLKASKAMALGITIRPLKKSAKSHTSSSFRAEPIMIQATTNKE